MLCMTEQTPSKFTRAEPLPMEAFFLELNLKEKRWLLSWSYNPRKENIKTYLKTVPRN